MHSYYVPAVNTFTGPKISLVAFLNFLDTQTQCTPRLDHLMDFQIIDIFVKALKVCKFN